MELSFVKFTSQVDVDDYVMLCDPLLRSFMEGVSNKKFSNLSTTAKMKIGHTIENIYGLCNLNWILPLSFSTNLVQSAVSGSKMVTEINGKVTSGGGYGSYRNWLKENGKLPLKCPTGDIQTYIDNIGKYVTKSYRVSKDKVQCAVITTTLHLVLDDEGLQKKASKQASKPASQPASK